MTKRERNLTLVQTKIDEILSLPEDEQIAIGLAVYCLEFAGPRVNAGATGEPPMPAAGAQDGSYRLTPAIEHPLPDAEA